MVIDAHITCEELFNTLVPASVRDQAIYLTQAVGQHTSHTVKMTMAQTLLDRMATAKLSSPVVCIQFYHVLLIEHRWCLFTII